MTYLLARTIMEGQNADSENLEKPSSPGHTRKWPPSSSSW